KSTLEGFALILRRNSPRTVSVIFLISGVGSSRIIKSPSKISGRIITKSMSGTASRTETQEIMNCRPKGLFMSNIPLSVTMSFMRRSRSSVAFFTFCSGSQASLLSAPKMSV
ncbi:GSCOCG00008504001-RA-CDS, partial [Cotesia congregata]